MFDFQQGGMILKKYLPILKNSPFFTGLTDNEILSILPVSYTHLTLPTKA